MEEELPKGYMLWILHTLGAWSFAKNSKSWVGSQNRVLSFLPGRRAEARSSPDLSDHRMFCSVRAKSSGVMISGKNVFGSKPNGIRLDLGTFANQIMFLR